MVVTLQSKAFSTLFLSLKCRTNSSDARPQIMPEASCLGLVFFILFKRPCAYPVGPCGNKGWLIVHMYTSPLLPLKLTVTMTQSLLATKPSQNCFILAASSFRANSLYQFPVHFPGSDVSPLLWPASLIVFHRLTVFHLHFSTPWTACYHTSQIPGTPVTASQLLCNLIKAFCC